MASTIQINVLGDVKDFQKSMRQVQNDLGAIGKASSKAGTFLKNSMKVAAVGAVALGVGIAKVAKDSVQLASAAEQSLGATQQIFGKYADDVVKMSNKAADAYGLSANDYRENSNLLAALFKNQGVAQDQLASSTDRMIGRAADLAAMYGGTTSTAVEALTAAYKGEYNQLEKYGVTLNQTMVNEEMRRRGLDNLTGASKRAAEQQVKTDIILKQSSDAQGQAAREADTFAGAMQRISAKLDNLKVKIGTALLPIIQKLLAAFEKDALPALERFAAWFDKEGPAAIDKVVAKFNEFLPTIQKVAGFVKDNAKQLGIAVVAFYGLTTALAIIVPLMKAYAIAKAAVTAATAAYTAVQTAATAAALGTRIQLALLAVQTAVTSAVTKAAAAAQWLLNAAMTANPIGLVIAAIVALVAVFVIAYKKSETFRAIVDKSWAAIKAATVAVWNFLKRITIATWNGIKSAVTSAANGVKSVVVKVWNAIKSASSAVWNAIKAVVSSVVRAVVAVIRGNFNTAKAVVTAAWNFIKAATTRIWNGIKTAVSTAVNGLMTIVNGIKGKVTGVFTGAAGWLLGAGKAIIQGLLDGIGSMIGSVKNKLGELTGMIPDWKGPAKKDKRLLRPTGRMIIQGLINGFDDGVPGMKSKLEEITKQIEKSLRKAGLSKKAAKEQAKVAERWFKANRKTLNKYTKLVTKATKKTIAAQEKLDEAIKARTDYKAGIVNKITDYGSISNLNSAFTAEAMLKQMQARIEKVKAYNILLNELVARGLNKNMVDQLAQAGVEGGMAYAQAIAQGGPEAVKQFNAMQKELEAAANVTGNIAADHMHAAGIQAAQGLVNGLKAKEKDIERQAKRFAKLLTKAIKKALKIKSPSRVFAEIGKYTVAGLAQGLGDNRELAKVQRAAGGMTGRIERGFNQPSLSLDATHAGSAGQTHNVTLNVNVAATADKAAVGREVASALDAYYKQGGRRLNL